MPRRTPPSFDFYPDDFMGGTYYMDGEALAMYVRSICFQWGNDLLPDDPQKLAKIMNVSEDIFARYWPQVRDKFVNDGNGGLYNARLKSEKDKKLGISEKRADAGRKGGEANAKQLLSKRGSKKEAKGRGKKALGRGKKGNGSGKPEGGAGHTNGTTSGFGEFWAAVSKRTGMDDARPAYAKAVKKLMDEGKTRAEAEAFLLDRMRAFAQTPKGQSGRFCPNPSTWLNQGRYHDDPEVWQDAEGPKARPILEGYDRYGNLK